MIALLLLKGTSRFQQLYRTIANTVMNSSNSPSSAPGGGTRAHACVLCQQRKVKCSRETPCSACIKSRVECVYRDPAPPKRRKRRSPEDILIARLRRYEELLENAGVKVDGIAGATGDVADAEHVDQSRSRRAFVADNTGHSQSDKQTSRRNEVSDGLPSKRAGSKPATAGRFIVEEGRSRYLEK